MMVRNVIKWLSMFVGVAVSGATAVMRFYQMVFFHEETSSGFDVLLFLATFSCGWLTMMLFEQISEAYDDRRRYAEMLAREKVQKAEEEAWRVRRDEMHRLAIARGDNARKTAASLREKEEAYWATGGQIVGPSPERSDGPERT